MMNKTDSQSPDRHLVMREIDIREHASKDAQLDGTGSLFQSFKARLIQLGGIVTDNYATNTVQAFRTWANETGMKFDAMSGNIPPTSDIFITRLETQTMRNLATANAKYSGKIIHLEKEKHRWQQRFPELGQHLDKPPQKNAFLLGGLVLFLVAVESIANSQFFAGSSEYGLLGGTLTAITISLGNVLIPLGLAFFGHRWFHRYDSWHIFGIVMVGLFLLWAFGFNHLVTQYRESLGATGTSGTLNYVLLFALGTAVAGISFWKMWSFLDPFKQARKCLDDLERTKKEFEETVCADLREAEGRCDEINTEINQLETSIPNKFRTTEAEFNRVHSETIEETNRCFATYHVQYCVMKVDPDPKLPVVTLGSAMEYNVGVPDSERDFFREMETLLDGQIERATNEWSQTLHDILKKINDLIRKFQEVITAKLLEWEGKGQGSMA